MRPDRKYIWLEEFLEDPDILKPATATVPRLVWKNRLTMLAGRDKGGKSTLAGAIAAAVSSGTPFLDGETLKGPVLIVSMEEHPQDFVQRLVHFGASVDQGVAVFRPTSANVFADVREMAEEIQPVLIIWDTLAALGNLIYGSVLDSNDQAKWTALIREVLDITREYGSSLLLHHTTKHDGEYRDSTAIGAAVDVVVTMRGRGKGPRNLKTAPRTAGVPLDEFNILLEDDRFRLIESEKEIQKKILDFVMKNPRCSARDLVEGISGVRAEDITKAKAKLLKENLLANVGEGQKHSYMAVL